MAGVPTITRIETIEFAYPLEDVGTDGHGFNLVYEPGATTERRLFGVRVETDAGVTGEYVGGNSPAMAQLNTVADYLIGRDLLAREDHWSELKRALRKYDRMGIGPVDIAMWDAAGKLYDAPIHELLGSYRDRLPAYASTYQGDAQGGLDSPEAYADFAEECLEMGYGGFKIHGWGGSDAARDIEREIETVHAVGDRVGEVALVAAPDQPVFIDPRIELYPMAQWHDYINLSNGENVDALLAKYRIDGLLLNNEQQEALLEHVRADPGWDVRYKDAESTYLVKRET